MAIPERALIQGYQHTGAEDDDGVIVRGKVKEILVREGKPHEVRFLLALSDTDVIRLLRSRDAALILTIQREEET